MNNFEIHEHFFKIHKLFSNSWTLFFSIQELFKFHELISTSWSFFLVHEPFQIRGMGILGIGLRISADPGFLPTSTNSSAWWWTPRSRRISFKNLVLSHVKDTQAYVKSVAMEIEAAKAACTCEFTSKKRKSVIPTLPEGRGLNEC